MYENVRAKLILILVLLGAAAGLLFLRDHPFRLGLDLRGGTRMVWRFDFDEAYRTEQLSKEEDPSEVIQQTISIIYNRVDPKGVVEPIIRQEGTDRLVVELPGTAILTTQSADGRLGGEIGPADEQLQIEDQGAAATAAFPANGGVLAIEGERIRYERRSGTSFSQLTRGHSDTTAAAHAAGAALRLIADDAIRNAIENLGELAFRIVANPSDLSGQGTDMAAERKRLEDWAAKFPGLPITSFNAVPPEQGGPHPMIEWHPYKVEEGAPARTELELAQPLLKPTKVEWDFTGQDLARTFRSQDQNGIYPAVGFEFKPQNTVAFSEFTRTYKQRNMAIVLNGEIASAPVINAELPGSGVIEGKFTLADVDELVTVLRSGSLRIRPILEQEERVGPTLGADNVSRNIWAGILSLVIVCGGMIVYYRRLGVFASISLLANLLLLMGGMAFIDATLTLPGIGGIILTIGMALDANILIFDRIREEADRGANAKQAAKTGFEKALSAIVDSNVTTLIAGLILYNVGTGPVRGFAVTLSIGILSTLFAQLVITRVMVHYALVRGVTAFPMGRWLADADFRILSKARACIIGSVLVIGAGLALFAWLPVQDKLGIQFLGGATVQFRTEAPQTRESIQALVGAIEGPIGESAEIKPVGEADAGERYTSFRATFKVPEGAVEQGETGSFAQTIRESVASVIQRGPVEAVVSQEEGRPRAELRLYFEEDHPAADVGAVLSETGLVDPVVEPVAGLTGQFHANGGLVGALDSLGLQTQVQQAFFGRADSRGAGYNLASPIAKSELVGKQIVGELKDKAVLAVLLSMFSIVLYIRVRFAEYAYGIAAMVAVAHDVLFTLVACALAIWLGIVNAEIDLTMIAVLLTIVGYSINDTIVIFDRIRENLPRMQKPLAEVIEISINETFSRTILTSATTFTSVAVMLAFNLGTGNELEGFCYALLAGMISGVYSTIYIASPVLLWLEQRSAARQARAAAA